jgi:hypothetical protein
MPNKSSPGKSLLDRLTDLRWPVAPSSKDKIYLLPGKPVVLKKPSLSYKNKNITVTIALAGFPLTYSVPLKKLVRIIDKLSKIADGTLLFQSLIYGLLWAQQLFAPQGEGNGKPRGRHAKSKAFVTKLKYAASWTHEFVKQEWQKPCTDRYVPLQRAQEKLKEERDGRECLDDVEMTAFLVFHAYRSERKQHKIENPWQTEFSRENFIRRYLIKSVTNRIRSQIKRKRVLLIVQPIDPVAFHRADEAEKTWTKACQTGRFRNPILREVFNPWSSD